MDNLYYKVKLYLEANSKSVDEFSKLPKTIKLEDHNDGKGATITFWNVDGLDKPTDSQLNAFDEQASKLNNNSEAIYNRLKEYPEIGDVIDAIFKKEAGNSSEFDSLVTARNEIKSKYPKE